MESGDGSGDGSGQVPGWPTTSNSSVTTNSVGQQEFAAPSGHVYAPSPQPGPSYQVSQVQCNDRACSGEVIVIEH